MSVLAVASVKGAPGATLTAQVLAQVWPRPVVLVDADPAGGDLLYRCRTVDGEPLDPDRGLLSLAAAARRDVEETSLAEHLQETAHGPSVLVGITSQEQLTGVGSVWSQLPSLLAAHDTDVLVDCGRLGSGAASLPVAMGADALLIVVRPDIEGVAHLRSRVTQLRSSLRPGDPEGTPVLVAVATSYRDRDSAKHLQQLLDSEGIAAEVVGVVARDPKTAQVLSSLRHGNAVKSLLARSAVVIAERAARAPSRVMAGSL